MILIEYIRGESMLDIMLRARGTDPGDPDRDGAWEKCGPLDYRLLPPEEERLDILARIIEGEIATWWHGGVRNGDLEPRNVIISRSGPSNAVSRVAIVDFNAAYVLHRCERGRRVLERRAMGSKLPISPTERYWSGSAFNCRGAYHDWIPESWATTDPDVSDARALDWLVARWKGSPNYQPLTKRFLSHPAHEALNEHARRHLEELRVLSERSGEGTGE